MSRNGIIPTTPRFALVKRRAYEVLVNIGAEVLPIDPFKTEEYFPNIHVDSYMELKTDMNPDPFFFDERNLRNAFLEFFSPNAAKGKIDGETHIFRGAGEYCVVYDDRVGSNRRIRWTVAHELGHVFLGHQTALYRGGDEQGGLTDEEYGVLEIEAHFFAAMFLAPENVLRKITEGKTWQVIAEICDISDDAAIRHEKNVTRVQFSSYPIDLDIHRNFYHYVCKVNGQLDKSFKPRIDALPREYEDYAEFEHWDFVVFAIGAKERNGELGAALKNSIALYDDGDMLIITGNDNFKATADKNHNVILSCLKKYGKVDIDTLSVMSEDLLIMLS